ncbi:NAD(P)-dependent dehydrogenase (short-subunit alcohol dehydrogenase family) [Mycobacterium sp. OAS707]|uniref:SDR family oxidoreductase n=1 Tax=Mycobacterium sp. OAS707 TaxID=2663822 RepID=UPI0017891C85|nr:SDR family oxidoreductase [Mycobacterium sp. OAS707]MBE1552069.1 NAD(P)-dependent dehydrogenase (short-subunit alcohol dehydrogenase family) [Mycobacterium sp. OAS707]
MDLRISGKTALVVGGSRGMGLEVAKMLAIEGAKVAVVARTQEPIDRAVSAIADSGGTAIGVAADMSTEAGIAAAITAIGEQFGPPLIAVTQADSHVRGTFEEVTRAEDYVDAYRTFTLSQVFLLRAVLPAMKDAAWGRFVHIGSGTAKEPQSTPPHTVANATRPSTIGLLKSVADEYARFGITINTVAPGWIATDTTEWYLKKHEGLSTDEQRRAFLIERAGVPSGRLGKPDEIASTIAYLCSESAGYITGHYITVDGGLHRAAF